MAHFQRHLSEVTSAGTEVLIIEDAGYPAALARVRDAPALLFVRGSLSTWGSQSVAIVGTRTPDNAGRSQAKQVAAFLAARGTVVVSGLARGIDTCAHIGALAAGGRTLAVLGGGLANIYPPENEALAREIVGSGALMCECCPMAKVSPTQLIARNRLIADLCDAVVVIQARSRGGSFAAARRAIRGGKPVFVLRQRLPQFVVGTERLASVGGIVTTMEELFERLAGPLDGRAVRRGGQLRI
jgi:DNA processing protein